MTNTCTSLWFMCRKVYTLFYIASAIEAQCMSANSEVDARKAAVIIDFLANMFYLKENDFNEILTYLCKEWDKI